PKSERAQGEHLPHTLARRGKKVGKRVCGRTKIADPAARSERGRVKQDSAGTREWHQEQLSAFSLQVSGKHSSSRPRAEELRSVPTYTIEHLAGLRALFGPRTRQPLHFILIDLDPVRFFHFLAQVGHEQLEQFVLLGFSQRLADLVFLGGVFRIGGRLLLEKLRNHAIGARRNGRADFARLQRENRAGRAGHGTDVGNLAIGRDQFARL